MTNSTTKPTTVFWVIGTIALLWNLMGVMAYLGQAYMTSEAMALLPEADQAYYNNIPAWVTASFAISVFAGALGCIALLMKKRIATLLFYLSLIGVLAQFVYNFFIQEYMDVSGAKILMPIVVIIVALFLIWYSKKTTQKGWLV